MMAKKDKIQYIYEDDNIIVINKPAGYSVTKDRSGRESIIDLIEQEKGKEIAQCIRLVHRLDKPTSGILLLAKHIDAQRLYSQLWAKREVQKTYITIVQGYCPKDSGIIKTRIAPSRKNPGTMTVDPRKGKETITEWRKLADFGNYSLIMAKPLTGRTHQIRIHMKTIGLPLAIDPLYGGSNPILLSEIKRKFTPSKAKDEKPLIDRLTLHAYQLTIPDTEFGPAMTFVAPFDNDFAAAVKMLAKHNPQGINAFDDPAMFEKLRNAQPLE